MGSANEDEDAPEESSSPGWVETSGSTDKTPGRIVAAALGEDIRRNASAEFPDPMPVVDITETPEVTETARASLIDLRREIDLINEEARVPEPVAALASDDDLEAIRQRNSAGSASTSEFPSTSPTDRVSVRKHSPQPAPATQAPVETPHVAPPVTRTTDAVAPEDVFATHPYSGSDDVPLRDTTAPSGSSRTFALLTIALLLAVVSGVLGAMWVRERSISDDLRAELVIAEQPEDTSDLTAQLDGLANEVATLEARNEQLEQQLARESALVPRVPEGRLEEIIIPFTPAYVGEVRGRFIAVDGSGEYVVWGGGVEDEITDTGSLTGSPTGIFASREHAWIATDADVIEAVSLVGGDDLELIEAPGITRLVRDARAFWGFVDDTRELQRFRQANGKRTTSVQLPVGISELTVGAGAVWALGDDGSIYRVNTADFTMSPLDAGQQVIGIAGGADALWALSAADGSLRRVDAVTGEILVTVPVGRDPIDVVVSGNSVWVALRSGSSLIEVDTRTNAIVSRTTLPGTPTEITQGETGVLVTLEGDTPVVRVASLEE